MGPEGVTVTAEEKPQALGQRVRPGGELSSQGRSSRTESKMMLG